MAETESKEHKMKMWRLALGTIISSLFFSGITMAASKPNILVIWGDDVGVHNISAYNHGIMG